MSNQVSTDNEEVLSVTESVCPECLAVIPAERIRKPDGVYLRKVCPEHGQFETIIWRGKPCINTWVRPKIPTSPQVPFTDVDKGCPFDCGLCPEHHQQTCTALLEVTQRCNLSCAFCFASSGNGAPPDPERSTITMWYQRLLDAGGPYNIQLSGGEPTMRDDLPEIIAIGQSLGFKFIQINTNGIRLAQDTVYLKALKEAGLSSVFLQFDGTEDKIYRRLRNAQLFNLKKQAIENCAAHNIGVVLVPTLVPGVNIHNIGAILDFAIQYAPVVRGVHFQPVSYFGRYPTPPTDDQRITIPEVIRAIEAQTEWADREHFIPPGCENAKCSFHANYVMMPDNSLHPWTHHNSSSCSCKPIPAAEGAEKSRSFVAHHWSGQPKQQTITGADKIEHRFGDWDTFLERIKTHTFCVSGMAFQDVWNLDLERLQDCCIHTISPDGRIIPFCAYNLTDSAGTPLYRPG